MSGTIKCGVRRYSKIGSNSRSYFHFYMQIDGSNETELRFFFEGCIKKMKDDGFLPQEITDGLMPASSVEDAKRGA